MPVVGIKFVPDHEGIRGFLHSEELRDAVRKAGKDVIDVASGESVTLDGNWHVEPGADVTIGLYSRLTEEVVNTSPAAAAIEFGSGPGNFHKDDRQRPQGGSSGPKRVLGRAGARIGDYRGEFG